MKTFLVAALQTIVRALVGALNYERVKLLVTDLESTDLTGTQKKARVIAECQSIVLEMGAWLLNLAIEAIVAEMNIRRGK
jgi:hypothetical protein